MLGEGDDTSADHLPGLVGVWLLCYSAYFGNQPSRLATLDRFRSTHVRVKVLLEDVDECNSSRG